MSVRLITWIFSFVKCSYYQVVKEDEEESGGMEFTWNDDEEKPAKQIETGNDKCAYDLPS